MCDQMFVLILLLLDVRPFCAIKNKDQLIQQITFDAMLDRKILPTFERCLYRPVLDQLKQDLRNI